MPLLRLAFALFLPLSLLQAGFSLFSQPELEVITTSYVTEEGAKHPVPSPAAPVYYMAIDLGYKDLGGIIAGDKLPTRRQINEVMAKVLAKQGYLPATNKNPPTQVLTWYWGTFYVQKHHAGDVNMPSPQSNRRAMLAFLGGDRLEGGASLTEQSPFPEHDLPAGVTQHSAELERYLDAASGDLYVIAIGGYDLEAIRSNGLAKNLWITKIAAPSRGFDLNEVLPNMLAIAAPNIGRNNDKPVWVSADERFKGEVSIGESTVVPEKDTRKPAEGKPEASPSPAVK